MSAGSSPTPGQDGYERSLEAQIGQYGGGGDIHLSSPAAHWMNQRHLAPLLREAFGAESVVEIYSRHLASAVLRSGIAEVVSLGSGSGALEIGIARWARDHGMAPFRITCLELSPGLAREARQAACEAGVDDLVQVIEADLNREIPVRRQVGGFMAHHSLHHLVELEQVFGHVRNWLHPEGAFVTMDMIGRNGHMCWPETLKIVRGIWSQLPAEKRWDQVFQRLDQWYENWDCSIEGFEGVRAQDIMAGLTGHFRFERFVANGSLVSFFSGRRFGPNFDLENPLDREFLERLKAFEDRLCQAGLVRPTALFAVLRSPHSRDCPDHPVCAGFFTPERAVLVPQQGPGDILDGFASPYPEVQSAPLPLVRCRETVHFAGSGEGAALLRWGWDTPEEHFVWSVGIDSALEFQAGDTVKSIELRFIVYRPPEEAPGSLTLFLNGTRLASTQLGILQHGCVAKLLSPLPAGTRVLLELVFSRPRRPDIDGGPDKRPLGIALKSLELA